MSIPVLIAVRGAREAELAAAIAAAPGMTVARRCADLGEAVAAAQAGVGTVAIVSEQAHLHRGVVADLGAAGLSVVGAPASPDAAEHLRSVGIADLIPWDAEPSAVAAIVERAASRAPEPLVPVPVAKPGGNAAWRGSVIAVWGPTGAPGRTTLAVSMAYDLAQRDGSLLMDLDTYGGAVAQALGMLDESPGVAALARASLHGSLTSETVARHALEAAPGLRVLTGVTRADRWIELSEAALEPVWPLVREFAPVTVVDCGFSLERDEELQYDTRAPQRNGATLAALAEADAIVVVGSAEPLGVQRLVHALAELDTVVPRETTPRVVVVNRVRTAVAGPRPREAVADALRRYAGVEKTWTVGWDPRACDAATLAGKALGERAPRSAARRAIQAVGVEAVRLATTVRAPVR